MFNKKKTQEYNIGIDIGTYTARAVVTLPAQNPKELPEIIAVAACESKGLRSGYITHIDDARETINELVSQLQANSQIEVKKANISMGGISLISETITGEIIVSRGDNIIGPNDINRSIEEAQKKINLTNREILHTIPLSYKVDGKEVLGRPNGLTGQKLETKVLFIVCLKQHLLDLLDICSDAGIEIEHVVASPIAAGCVAMTEIQKQSGAMLANIGAETVSIVVYENSLPISVKIFAIGGSDFTKDIALGLKIPIEEAEQVKQGRLQGAHSERKLADIIEARLRDIFELLEKHLKKIGRDALLPAGIIITGGGSHISQMENLAKSSLKLPCRIGIPEHLLQMKPRIRDVSWLVAYGLCVYKDYGGTEEKQSYNTSTKSTNTKQKLLNFLHDLMP